MKSLFGRITFVILLFVSSFIAIFFTAFVINYLYNGLNKAKLECDLKHKPKD